MARAQVKPRAILLSKRAHVAYVEYARVLVKDDRVVYLTETGESVDQFFNIPYRNTALLMLGKGTSITDAAARKLAEAQVIIGFCGSGGSPLLHAVDAVFSSPQSEYRPTEYMQGWMRLWLDEERRLNAARHFMQARITNTLKFWGNNEALQKHGVEPPLTAAKRLENGAKGARNTSELMGAEAVFAKELYATLARACKLDFKREEGKGSHASAADIANGFLDHGNYIAYGYAAVALHALGISFALPVLHGKTRRGALVFDVADIVKDALVMPLAFTAAAAGASDQDFRVALIDRFQTESVVDLMILTIQSALAE